MVAFRDSVTPALVRAADVLRRLVGYAGRFQGTIRAALWVTLLLVLAGIVLDYEIWTRQDIHRGPFRVAVADKSLYAVDIGPGIPFWLGLRLIDNDPGGEPGSAIRLRQDGRVVDLSELPRPTIMRAPNYWIGRGDRELAFALPTGLANDRRLTISIDYFLALPRTANAVVLTVFLLLGALWLASTGRIVRWWALVCERSEGTTRAAPGWSKLLVAFPLIGWVVVAACLGYIAAIAYGAAAGHALPSATVFFLAPPGLLSNVEPYFPLFILLYAAAGTAAGWTATLRILPADDVQRTELRLARFWGWWGAPAILCLFLFSISAGGWSGAIRPHESNYMSIAGLVPHSDARAYFTDAYQMAFFGQWGPLGSRRPLGEAFRQIAVVAGLYSYVWTLIVQMVMVAVALFFAARAVANRYGIWAGIAFVGFVYLIVRPFLQTTMSEALGLVWVLFAIVYLLESFRLHSLPHALIALAALTIALMTRMGSMFTVPMVVLWIAIWFGSTIRERLVNGAVACAVVMAVFALNALLAHLYASPYVATGSNFAYTLCGLSLGTDWSDCSRIHASQLGALADERSRAGYLIGVAWQNVVQNPSVFLLRLVDNATSYFKGIPRFLLAGYSPGYHFPGSIANLAVVAFAISSAALCYRRGSRIEGSFWILLLASVGLSAAIVFADDGWRTLHVTHVLVACLVAAGFAAPATTVAADRSRPMSWRFGAGIVAIAAVLYVTVPWLSHLHMGGIANAYRPAKSAPPDERIISGGRFLTGFQVVADGSDRPLSMPTLFASEFVRLTRLAPIEDDFGPFVKYAIARVPFALVVAGRFDNIDQSNIYIAPVTILERSAVPAWRVTTQVVTQGSRPTRTLREIVTAEPIAVDGGEFRQ